MKPRLFRARYSAFALAVVLLMSVGFATAENTPETEGPGAVVESLSTQLLDMARKGQQKLKDEPEAFYAEIEVVLEPIVGFEFIAKNVMGETYWDQSTEKQRSDFLKVFKRSLVETYVKGMSQNLDYELEILDEESKIFKSKASIVQKISGADSTNLVVYTLGLGKSGAWKVLNVVLDGVNLGKTFRGQFAQGVKDNKGDIDATIAGWSGKS